MFERVSTILCGDGRWPLRLSFSFSISNLECGIDYSVITSATYCDYGPLEALPPGSALTILGVAGDGDPRLCTE